jgi:hypothetical protein
MEVRGQHHSFIRIISRKSGYHSTPILEMQEFDFSLEADFLPKIFVIFPSLSRITRGPHFKLDYDRFIILVIILSLFCLFWKIKVGIRNLYAVSVYESTLLTS